MKPGELLQHRHHSPIVFERMEPRPRQLVSPRFRIPILGLMHVPQQRQMHAIHRDSLSRFGCDAVLHSRFAPCASWTAILSAKYFATHSSALPYSRLFFLFPNLFSSWSCLSVTPAWAPKSSSFSSAFFPPSSRLPC